MTIREYLSQQARLITDNSLAGILNPEIWSQQRPERLSQFYQMMGVESHLTVTSRVPPNVQVTGIVERTAYRIEKLIYESLPQVYVSANLYIPNEPNNGKFPAILYVCGHSPIQKIHYQAQGRRFAELGFVCLVVDTIQFGEIPGYHHGCYREGWWH